MTKMIIISTPSCANIGLAKIIKNEGFGIEVDPLPQENEILPNVFTASDIDCTAHADQNERKAQWKRENNRHRKYWK